MIRFAGESVGNGWSFGGGRETFCRSPKTTRGGPASGRTDLRGERALDKDGGGCKTALSMVSGWDETLGGGAETGTEKISLGFSSETEGS